MTRPSSPYLVYGIPVNETQLGFKFLQRGEKKEHPNWVRRKLAQGFRTRGVKGDRLLTVLIERGLQPRGVGARDEGLVFPKEGV